MTTIEGTSTSVATRREMCALAITTTIRIATTGRDRIASKVAAPAFASVFTAA
jgi:hypothetical protein